MLNLALFPGEVLAVLFRLPCASHAVVRLWKCGDRALNATIARFVDTVILEDKKHYSTSRWPKMLTKLQNLRVLRIHRNGYLAPVDILSSEVSMLSEKLVELEIRCVRALGAILIFNSPDDLKTLQKGGDVRVGDQSCRSIRDMFPRLRKLALQSVNAETSYPSNFYAFSTFCRDLPSTIEHIALYASLSSVDVNLVPASLKTIEASGWRFVDDHPLPPSVEYLTLSMTTVPFGKESERPKLLDHPNLKDVFLRLQSDTPSYTLRDTVLERVRISSMGRLKLPLDWWPESLTALSLPSTATTDFLKHLPRTLTELKISTILWSDIISCVDAAEDWQAAVKSLWPKLRHLSFNSSENPLPSPAAIAYLPSTLEICEKLEIQRLEDADELRDSRKSVEWTFNMPSIRTLRLSCGDLDFPNGVPPSLTKLEVSLWIENAVRLKCLQSSNIRSLSLNMESYDDKVQKISALLSNLPTKLESLALNFFNGYRVDWSQTKAWRTLPSTLAKLRITCTESEDDDFDFWRLNGAEILPFLPKQISNLEVTLTDLKPRDLLAMACRETLAVFKMNYGPKCSAFSPEYDDEFLTAWPPMAQSDSAGNWEYLDPYCLFYQRLRALDDRDRVYPDPRTINPNSMLKYGGNDEESDEVDLDEEDGEMMDDDGELEEIELEEISPGVYRGPGGQIIRLSSQDSDDEEDGEFLKEGADDE